MMRILSNLNVVRNYHKKTVYKIYRKTDKGWKVLNNVKKEDILQSSGAPNQQCETNVRKDETVELLPNSRMNELKIQMLSKSLYEQIFKNSQKKTPDQHTIERYKKTLESHGIKLGETPPLPDVDVKLPPLKGSNIIEHFHCIAHEQLNPYRPLIDSMSNAEIAPMPTQWTLSEGWTKYNRDGTSDSVPYPDDNALVFDIEVCMREGNAPTMACAVGVNNWYSWCSKSLVSVKRTSRRQRDDHSVRVYQADEMIQMESADNIEPRIVIGHNVSYDRARIRNQYELNPTKMRFLDTMSMHVCVSGVTSFQRAMMKSSKEIEPDDEVWSSMSSLNGLVDVFKLYCQDEKQSISKEKRSMFVEGSLNEIQKDFQNLMTYCANDVVVTHKVFKVLYPMFCERFPHPATLAGMLELGMAYLPVNSNWLRYINESDLIYKDFDIESKYLLAKRANQACRLLHNEAYKTDLWLWDEDWSVRTLAMKNR